ncbi:MAG: adenine methyltransferase [Alphaproteobacteria bacterium]|nr:MAG: adenine methyltransferase [Alphaproteobacteria bacterium]
MGSKNRISKHILPIILENRKRGQWYVEPFVGGANLIDKVGGNRIGADFNEYLPALYSSLQSGWIPPTILTEHEYSHIKANKDQYSNALVAFVGFACSYAAKWFGGYCRGFDATGKPRDYIGEAYRNVMKQAGNLQGIKFVHSSYDELEIPENSIIYCDPPYENTTKYKDSFDHDKFWQWCRDMSLAGHDVFISEYNAPADFQCIWEKEIISSLTRDTGAKKGIERLFKYKA